MVGRTTCLKCLTCFLYTDYQQSMFVFFYSGPQPFSNLNKVILLFFCGHMGRSEGADKHAVFVFS